MRGVLSNKGMHCLTPYIIKSGHHKKDKDLSMLLGNKTTLLLAMSPCRSVRKNNLRIDVRKVQGRFI